MCVHRACVEIDRLTHASKHAWINALSHTHEHARTHTHTGAVGIIGRGTSNLPLPAFLDSTFPGYHLASSKKTYQQASHARTHTHAHAHARTHARTRARTHTHTHAHTHTHTSMSTQTHISHVCLCCLRTYIDTAMHRSQTCTRVPATMSAASVPPPSDSESGRLLCFF